MPIRLKNLNVKNEKGASFTDIAFDLRSSTKDGGKRGSIINDDNFQGNDMVVSKDASAIRNALHNLLTTQPGERYVERDFGTNLAKFIGEPVTDSVGEAIGDEIHRAILRWEPRVKPLNIFTIAKPDDLLFEVMIIITSDFIDDEQIVIVSELDIANGVDIRFKDATGRLELKI